MYLPFQGFISSFRLLDILDILLVAFVLYKLFILIRNTRAVALIKGLLVLGVVTVVSKILDLHVINWMLQQGMTVILVALPVVFQPELRRALEQIGRGRFFRSGQVISMEELERLIDEIVAISESLSKTHTGALIVFEREVGLNDYIDTGIAIDGLVSGDAPPGGHRHQRTSRCRRRRRQRRNGFHFLYLWRSYLSPPRWQCFAQCPEDIPEPDASGLGQYF